MRLLSSDGLYLNMSMVFLVVYLFNIVQQKVFTTSLLYPVLPRIKLMEPSLFSHDATLIRQRFSI